MSNISNLGEDQWMWLNKYNTLSLEKWRLISNGNPPTATWMYIGDWTPYDSEGNRLPGKYIERDALLKIDKFHFWPK